MTNDEMWKMFTFIILAAMMFFIGQFSGRRMEKESAVQLKAAEYYIDENNNKAFRYLTIKECKCQKQK